jgi:hypothetical protein
MCARTALRVERSPLYRRSGVVEMVCRSITRLLVGLGGHLPAASKRAVQRQEIAQHAAHTRDELVWSTVERALRFEHTQEIHQAPREQPAAGPSRPSTIG